LRIMSRCSVRANATLSNGPVESLDAFEVGVDQRLVDKFPKMFGRLRLRAVGGLKDETEAIGDSEVLRTVPAGVVELKHDAL